MKLFRNRKAAGQALAARVVARPATTENPRGVVALPRGGVPVAYEIAESLHAPLDVLVVRKLGVPWCPELAYGAIASGDVRILNQQIIEGWGVSVALVDIITAREKEELERREVQYRGSYPPFEVQGCNVILVDDGIATGATMLAVIEALAQRHPAHLLVAVPVASTQTCKMIRKHVDELICLDERQWFDAVGSSYVDFSQVSDEEVRALLDEAHSVLLPLVV